MYSWKFNVYYNFIKYVYLVFRMQLSSCFCTKIFQLVFELKNVHQHSMRTFGNIRKQL